MQGLLSLQFLEVPAQAPPEQLSAMVQALPSSQEPDLGVFEQVPLLQVSVVQELLSLQSEAEVQQLDLGVFTHVPLEQAAV